MHSSEEYDMNNDWREYYDPQYVLMHHGIKGQKWGVRQYQNADGTLTEAGKKRYGTASGKVEKFGRKSAAWENRAINAKTGIGRQFATGMAANRRMKADKAAAKATGDYKMLALNKNSSRNMGAVAETNANVAAGLKKKAEGVADSKKRERLMDQAVKHLASAENAEMGAKTFKSVANAPVIAKGGTYIRGIIKQANNSYTEAGRKSNIKDKAAEAIGNAVIDSAFNLAKNQAMGPDPRTGERRKDINVASSVNAVGKVRDAVYRKQNSASKRWDKIMKG